MIENTVRTYILKVEQTDRYMVKVPNFEDSLAIKKRVLEEAVSCWESKILALRDGTIRKHKFLQKIKVMTT